MAITLRDSFIDVRITEDELKQHVLDVIKARPTGAERRSAIAYLRQIVHKDARDIERFQYINARAKQVLEERERLHTFDIRAAKHAGLFTTASNVNYATLLAVAGAEVIADGQTIALGFLLYGDHGFLHSLPPRLSYDVEAHNNLGAVLKELGKLDEAVASYRKAFALKPEFGGAHDSPPGTGQGHDHPAGN